MNSRGRGRESISFRADVEDSFPILPQGKITLQYASSDEEIQPTVLQHVFSRLSTSNQEESDEDILPEFYTLPSTSFWFTSAIVHISPLIEICLLSLHL